ncbi:serine/threonine protein kinase [Streptomyces phaeoluteigriseus]|uniref:non-specific serine/threonine protein kinase n=1 Tax=Streptomyces phaeoluteigriseus TaxID=114686 RepID=A0A1V6MJZ6_9ACTN|nr:serine/threonine-protein kinase [Streptomyces phaeoluteigriseus]OQD52622.1 serine/threonine protein kinase [Streptomyces phaeoluteigriseus]
MQGLLVAGRYRLVDAIGSGGMGRVWRAHDELLHRAVALKELTAALYVSESDRTVLLARTRAEARAAARINHSAVVTVHDVLEHDGRPWIVMELVEGRSLADAVKADGRVEPTEAARIGLWVLRALRAAHSAGVLHRDVKPGNVLLSDDGRVLLTDFGIAQIDGDTTITRTGEVVGSVDFLAPERVRGHDPGQSSDLWALGATLYTAVEGRSPFRRTSPLSTMQAVVEEEPAEPRYAGPLAPVIAALLRKDPAARPDTAGAERLLAEAAEGRRPDEAQAYIPTQYAGPAGHGTQGTVATGGTTGGTTGGAPHFTNGSATPYPASGPPSGPYAGATTPVPAASGAHAHLVTGGPTAIGPTGLGHGPSAPPPKPLRRRRLRRFVLVVVVAALVGGGTAVALRTWGVDGTAQGSGSPSPTASPSQTPNGKGSGQGTVADSRVDIDDPLGFGLSLPPGWERSVYQDDADLKQIDYSPDGGEHFVRIAIDASPDFDDPYAHQVDLEQQLQRLADYQRVTLERNTYRDRESARWEYTWTALAKDTDFPGPRRAIEETYISRDGTEYVIYMSSPAADWASTARQFTSVLQSWREPPSTS